MKKEKKTLEYPKTMNFDIENIASSFKKFDTNIISY